MAKESARLMVRQDKVRPQREGPDRVRLPDSASSTSCLCNLLPLYLVKMLQFMSLTGDTLFLWLAGLGFYMFDISFCASSLVWRYSCSWGVFIGATKFGMDLEYIDNHDSSTLRVNRLYGTSSTSACAGRVDGLEESG